MEAGALTVIPRGIFAGRIRYRGPKRLRWFDGYVIPLQRNGKRGEYRAVSVPGDLVGRPSGQKTFLVHRLVCEAFHGPPPDGATLVEHQDDDGTNNRSGNLFWSTPKANSNRDNCLRLNKLRNSGSNHANWGKRLSSETKAKMAVARRRWHENNRRPLEGVPSR